MPSTLSKTQAVIARTKEEWLWRISDFGMSYDQEISTILSMSEQDNPDAVCLAAGKMGDLSASCSLWWQHTPPWKQHKIALIGHYRAANDEDGRKLLLLALDELKRQGATMAVGPMDGSTWKRYRFITERGREPSFFLEPDNKDSYPEHFAAAGFNVLCNYYSAVSEQLRIFDSQTKDTACRLARSGVSVRNLRIDEYEQELLRIFSICRQSFNQNLFYTALSEEDFLKQYLPLRDFIVPALVTIAERQGEAVGFNFVLPDRFSRDTAIVKTLARLPQRSLAGLGNWLLARSQETAAELGFRRVIHALFHEENKSRSLSGRHADIMRRYSLFFREL